MPENRALTTASQPIRMKLEPYAVEIQFPKITVGLDNIHYDVFLSPRFTDFARKYLLDLIRQTINVSLIYGGDRNKQASSPEHSAFRRILTDILQNSLTQAKYKQSIETDILHRIALLKFITSELSNQFAALLVECKDWIRSRGELFEHSEQAHVLRSKIADIQADRKNVIRRAGETLCRIWREVEDTSLAKTRRALFGDEAFDQYALLQNALLFVDGGSDERFYVDNYVLLGNFMNDPDRFEVFDGLLRDFIQEFAIADPNAEELTAARKTHERFLEQARRLRAELDRVEKEQEELDGRSADSSDVFPRLFKRSATSSGDENLLADLKRRAGSIEKNIEALAPEVESAGHRVEFLADEYISRVGDYLNEPTNARRLFDASMPSGEGDPPPEMRQRLLEEWVQRLEDRDLLGHVLAGYEIRKIYSEYSPPIHLQQLKKAVVNRDEAKRVTQILEQYPARKISMKKLEESTRSIRRAGRAGALATGLQFAEDLMRLRRDRRNYQHVVAWMERINIVRSEHTRELSRTNKSLYEFLHPDERRPTDDPIINHTVIKADVRGSTSITKDLLSRGLNPASHFSMALHDPVKRMLERYGAAKVFIEGDAIILAIYETEATRASQRAVAKACVLSKEILAVTQAYNNRATTTDLPPLELGLGVAFQDSAPAVWMDGDSKIMISKALNLSDRLSGCSKIAKRLFQNNPAPFNVYVLQTLMDEAMDNEGEELLVRYNMNGIELNEEGFQKLSSEISLAPMAGNFPMPWGKERVQLYFGEVPIGESIEPVVIRKGFVRQLLQGGNIGAQGNRAYYEVCTDPRLLDVARKKVSAPKILGINAAE